MIIALPWMERPFFYKGKGPNFSINTGLMWYRDLRLSDDLLIGEVDPSIHQARRDWAPQIWPEDIGIVHYQYPMINSNQIAAVANGYATTFDEAKNLIDTEMIKFGIKVIDDKLAIML